uniref:Glycoprotein-N-acetylgalactosamine 3-beta-galactosyltransferase 1 n=2 Tax=Acrobeloides nanus TaxID=290746 RepID=A0A914DB28_9BILA
MPNGELFCWVLTTSKYHNTRLHGYNSGGAGYVLSNKAMKLLTEAIEKDQNFCSHSKWEDVGLGQCLEKLQIYPEKTSETNGAQRFLPFHFHQMLSGYVAGGDNDFYLPKDEKLIKDIAGISKDWITIHQTDPKQMLFIDFLLYQTQIHT